MMESLESEFLDKLLDPESSFLKPIDGIYTVDADDECFSAFLQIETATTMTMMVTL